MLIQLMDFFAINNLNECDWRINEQKNNSYVEIYYKDSHVPSNKITKVVSFGLLNRIHLSKNYDT